MKKATFVLLNEYADWEIAHLSSTLNESPEWQIETVSNAEEVMSIGGLKTKINKQVKDAENCDLLVLIGGNSWHKDDDHLYQLIKQIFADKKPIGAICGAVDYLARNGFLNEFKHTGNSVDLWKEYGNYQPEHEFIESQAIGDKNLVTANGTGELEFTEHVLKLIEFESTEEIDKRLYMLRHGFYEYCAQYGNPFE